QRPGQRPRGYLALTEIRPLSSNDALVFFGRQEQETPWTNLDNTVGSNHFSAIPIDRSPAATAATVGADVDVDAAQSSEEALLDELDEINEDFEDIEAIEAADLSTLEASNPLCSLHIEEELLLTAKMLTCSPLCSFALIPSALKWVKDTMEDDYLSVTYHIVYSPSFQVPVLYFNACRSNGLILPLEQIYESLVPNDWRTGVRNAGLSGGISQQDHPVLNVPFFYLHPCETVPLMETVQSGQNFDESGSFLESYIMTWISLTGQAVGLAVSTQAASEAALATVKAKVAEGVENQSQD
ncbi:hypothetical protein BGW38_004634, partial [Lunasporangiospora selenospora]